MDRPSQRFDQQLFTLKLSELSQEMQIQSASSDRKASYTAIKAGGSLLLKLADGQLALSSDWLDGVDRICREVWKIQAESVTPEFVRDILLPQATMLIEARKGAATSSIGLVARRTGKTGLPTAQRHLTKGINRLRSTMTTKYEIEIRALGHNKAKSLSKAPDPIKPVTGGGIMHSAPKPSEVPANPPLYFPGDLWPKTNLVLLEAQRKFPLRLQMREMCRRIVGEMTPILCEAVRTKRMSGNASLAEGLGGMSDLLHSVLAHNDDSPHSGFSSLSNKAYLLGREVRKSSEWFVLVKAIAAIQSTMDGQDDVSASSKNHKAMQAIARKRTGRPRSDHEREMIEKLKSQGKSWKEIARAVNVQTGQNKSSEAYRALLRSHSPTVKDPGKNVQN